MMTLTNKRHTPKFCAFDSERRSGKTFGPCKKAINSCVWVGVWVSGQVRGEGGGGCKFVCVVVDVCVSDEEEGLGVDGGDYT
jgi:hypothetical protein